MEKIEILMVQSKTTKGTVVYEAPGSAIPTLYIRKEGISGQAPQSIRVEVTAS